MIRELSCGTKEVGLIDPAGNTAWKPIEVIEQKFISIRWGQSGTYDIDLKTNTMKARSIAARRKGVCYWKVLSIETVRKMVWDYFHPNAIVELEKKITKHTISMPYYLRGKPLSKSKR